MSERIVNLSFWVWAREMGQLVTRKRRARKMSQAKLARRIGVSQSTVSRIESGQCNDLDVMVLGALAAVFGEPLRTFLPDLNRLPRLAPGARREMDDWQYRGGARRSVAFRKESDMQEKVPLTAPPQLVVAPDESVLPGALVLPAGPPDGLIGGPHIVNGRVELVFRDLPGWRIQKGGQIARTFELSAPEEVSRLLSRTAERAIAYGELPNMVVKPGSVTFLLPTGDTMTRGDFEMAQLFGECL
jgi:transcriptional regulator with XRE-family HTH domain/pterin-4a-carbinolamine dehydratase